MRRKLVSHTEMLELVEQTVATMQRSASTIAKLPLEDRAEALRVLDQTYAVGMRGRWQDPRAAANWTQSVMAGVRQLVTQIDESGGRYLKVIPRLTPPNGEGSAWPEPNKGPPFEGGS